jgi:CelD/BcsL family acetyltransferase involved in cellulose biosynthesis
LNLLHIPENSTTPSIIEDYFKKKGIKTRTVPFGNCPVFKCTGNKRADLKITKKKTEQRYYNHYRKSGDFEFKVCTSMTEVDTYLPAMFEQHVARFGLTSKPSKYTDESQREFLRLMTARLLPEAIPVFSVALFNGRPISTQYGFYYADKFTGYLLTHDPIEAKNSPGRLMLKLIMAEMIERGITEFDFGRGAGEYKLRFANGARQNRAVMVYNDKILSLLATLSYASQKVIRKAKDVVKSNGLTRRILERYARAQQSRRVQLPNEPEPDIEKPSEAEPAITDQASQI